MSGGKVVMECGGRDMVVPKLFFDEFRDTTSGNFFPHILEKRPLSHFHFGFFFKDCGDSSWRNFSFYLQLLRLHLPPFSSEKRKKNWNRDCTLRGSDLISYVFHHRLM